MGSAFDSVRPSKLNTASVCRGLLKLGVGVDQRLLCRCSAKELYVFDHLLPREALFAVDNFERLVVGYRGGYGFYRGLSGDRELFGPRSDVWPRRNAPTVFSVGVGVVAAEKLDSHMPGRNWLVLLGIGSLAGVAVGACCEEP